MTLQEQIREAWAIAPAQLNDGNISEATNLTVGILLGAGFPHAAMFVLVLVHDRLGHDHPDLVELRAKLGLKP